MIPTEAELINYLKKKKYPIFSDIARHFEINNATVSDLANMLVKKKKAKIEKVGGSKMVVLR